MNKAYPTSITRLIEEFCKMPGIGPHSAERMTFHILQSSSKDIAQLVHSIGTVKNNVKFCQECNNLSDHDLCSICKDTARDRSRLCVVEGPGSVLAMEKGSIHNGVYHVLLGELSPLDGVGPEELKIEGLIERLKEKDFQEVVIATDFTTEGETTALYLYDILRPYNIKISRLARGVPVGGSIEYADTATLQRAFLERRVV